MGYQSRIGSLLLKMSYHTHGQLALERKSWVIWSLEVLVFVLHFRNNRIKSLKTKCVLIFVLFFELLSVHYVNMFWF
jgi:hypothetical protein